MENNQNKQNPNKLKILCVCTMGLNRSKYLAEYLRDKGYDTRYGGIGPCRVDPEPKNPVKEEDIEWADIIITARKKHKPILKDAFRIKNKKVICLDVTDSRRAMSEIYPEFIKIEQSEFNQKWTYPQLRKEIDKHLPLKTTPKIKINLNIDRNVNFLMILYQIIKKQNSFENLHFKGIEKLEKEDKNLIKNILRNKKNILEKIKQSEKINSIYLENKESFKDYWEKNKNILEKIKEIFEKKCKKYDFSIFKEVGNFFDFQGPEEINIYLCLGNEKEIGTGNAFSPDLAFIFPRNFNNFSKKTIDLDFAVLIHEVMHLFQNMCTEKDKVLREKVAQCFAPRGILINEEKFNGDFFVFDKIKEGFQKERKYSEIRKDLLIDKILSKKERNCKEAKNEKL